MISLPLLLKRLDIFAACPWATVTVQRFSMGSVHIRQQAGWNAMSLAALGSPTIAGAQLIQENVIELLIDERFEMRIVHISPLCQASPQ